MEPKQPAAASVAPATTGPAFIDRALKRLEHLRSALSSDQGVLASEKVQLENKIRNGVQACEKARRNPLDFDSIAKVTFLLEVAEQATGKLVSNVGKETDKVKKDFFDCKTMIKDLCPHDDEVGLGKRLDAVMRHIFDIESSRCSLHRIRHEIETEHGVLVHLPFEGALHRIKRRVGELEDYVKNDQALSHEQKEMIEGAIFTPFQKTIHEIENGIRMNSTSEKLMKKLDEIEAKLANHFEAIKSLHQRLNKIEERIWACKPEPSYHEQSSGTWHHSVYLPWEKLLHEVRLIKAHAYPENEIESKCQQLSKTLFSKYWTDRRFGDRNLTPYPEDVDKKIHSHTEDTVKRYKAEQEVPDLSDSEHEKMIQSIENHRGHQHLAPAAERHFSLAKNLQQNRRGNSKSANGQNSSFGLLSSRQPKGCPFPPPLVHILTYSTPRMADTPKAGSPARVPGATGPQMRRRAAALSPSKKEVDAPNSLRAAGAGGSSSTMMRLYTQDDNPGLKIDPVIVLSLAVVFVFSVVFLHLFTKVIRSFSK